jgi:hypothetical protein
MVLNLLKRWRDDFATVKRQRDGFGAFQKETECHPTSSSPTSSTDMSTHIMKNSYLISQTMLSLMAPVFGNTFHSEQLQLNDECQIKN